MPDGVTISFDDAVVSLGVKVNSKVTREFFITQVTKKVNISRYSLRFIRAFTTKNLSKRLVESLVLQHLDYCPVLCIDASGEQ